MRCRGSYHSFFLHPPTSQCDAAIPKTTHIKRNDHRQSRFQTIIHILETKNGLQFRIALIRKLGEIIRRVFTERYQHILLAEDIDHLPLIRAIRFQQGISRHLRVRV